MKNQKLVEGSLEQGDDSDDDEDDNDDEDGSDERNFSFEKQFA